MVVEEGSKEWKAQNKGPWILVTCWLITAISTLFILARVYVRGFIHGKLQQDDYWSVVAQICGYISTALSTLAVANGNGKHFGTLTQEQQENAILWTTAAFCPGVMSFGLPKMAVIYLLTKLLNPGKWHKAFLWWMGIWCQLTLGATVGVLIGRCRPAHSLWNFDVEGECFPNHILVSYCIYAGSFSAFVDLYLAIYPAIVLFGLQLSIKKKAALIVALSIGSVSGIVAIYKTTRIPSLGSPDFSYDTSDLVVWTVIEGSTIMIASAIPILQPLLEKILRRNPFSSHSNSKPYKYPERHYEDYSDMRSHTYELGERKQKPKLKDDLGLTVLPDDQGSEEEILRSSLRNDGKGASEGTVEIMAAPGTAVPSPTPGAGHNRIMRTDKVVVTYENGRQGPLPGEASYVPPSWNQKRL